MTEEKRIVRSLREVAKAMDVAVGTITNWRREGMPGSPRAWDLEAIAEWREERGGGKRGGRKKGATAKELEKWELRHKKAMALIQEENLRLRRQELVERAEVREVYVGRILDLRKGVLNLHRNLKTLDDGYSRLDRQEEIEGACRSFLMAFARGGIPGVEPEYVQRFLALLAVEEKTGKLPPERKKAI